MAHKKLPHKNCMFTHTVTPPSPFPDTHTHTHPSLPQQTEPWLLMMLHNLVDLTGFSAGQGQKGHLELRFRYISADVEKVWHRECPPHADQADGRGTSLKYWRFTADELGAVEPVSRGFCSHDGLCIGGTANAEIKNPPWWKPRAIKGSLFLI